MTLEYALLMCPSFRPSEIRSRTVIRTVFPTDFVEGYQVALMKLVSGSNEMMFSQIGFRVSA
jgi:hypothetical protein